MTQKKVYTQAYLLGEQLAILPQCDQENRGSSIDHDTAEYAHASVRVEEREGERFDQLTFHSLASMAALSSLSVSCGDNSESQWLNDAVNPRSNPPSNFDRPSQDCVRRASKTRRLSRIQMSCMSSNQDLVKIQHSSRES